MAPRKSKRLASLLSSCPIVESAEAPTTTSSSSISQPLESTQTHSFSNSVFSCPEVLELIISHLKLRDQKNCRFVCKAWNQELCRIFRKNLVVPVQEKKNNWKRLSGLRAVVKAGKNIQLPIPFNHLKLVVDSKHFVLASKQVQELSFSVTAINFTVNDFSDIKDVQEMAKVGIPLIKAFSSTLTHLITPAWGIPLEGSAEPFNLPALKSLTLYFRTFDYAGENISLFNNQKHYFLKCLTAVPNLQEFHVDGDERCDMLISSNPPPSNIPKCLSVPDLSRIQTLSVHISSAKRDPRASDKDLLLDVVAGFSDSLQEFSTNFVAESKFALPFCPKLSYLYFDTPVKFKYLDFFNLPNLKRIKLYGSVFESYRERLLEIPSVEFVSIGMRHARGNKIKRPADACLKALISWFPNARIWKVTDPWLYQEFLVYVKKNDIKNLSITPKDAHP